MTLTIINSKLGKRRINEASRLESSTLPSDIKHVRGTPSIEKMSEDARQLLLHCSATSHPCEYSLFQPTQ
jgi:hypothetical protein